MEYIKETQLSDGGKLIETFDSDKLIKKVGYDQSEKIDSTILYQYDANGNNIKRDIYDGDQEQKIRILEYKFLDNKLVEELESYGTGELIYKTQYDYQLDQSGREVVNKKSYDATGKLIDEQTE